MPPNHPPSNTNVRTGLDLILAEQSHLIRGRQVGLVTSASAVTRDLVPAADALRDTCSLVALFGPEHGITAHAADGAAVDTARDLRTGLPVYSLYGKTKKPTAEMLRDVQVLVFDIQDVGVRFYTYIWTMSYALEAAAEHGVPIIILDRPNPIGGEICTGPTIEPMHTSFVGRYLLPVRHGMTAGELAHMFNVEHNLHANLTVVPVTGWQRSMWFDQTGLPWVPPSPAMPKLETAIVYPGTCLLEGTNIAYGRGTATPFECLGAPWIDGYGLASELNKRTLPGVRFRPTFFTPAESLYTGKTCQGVFVHVTDREQFRPLHTGLEIVSTIRSLYDAFSWLETSWEGHPPHFDLLIGNGWVRKQIDAGRPVTEITLQWQVQLQQFKDLRAQYVLYK